MLTKKLCILITFVSIGRVALCSSWYYFKVDSFKTFRQSSCVRLLQVEKWHPRNSLHGSHLFGSNIEALKEIGFLLKSEASNAEMVCLIFFVTSNESISNQWFCTKVVFYMIYSFKERYRWILQESFKNAQLLIHNTQTISHLSRPCQLENK